MPVTKLEVRPGVWRLREDYRDADGKRRYRYETVQGNARAAEKARVAMAVKAGMVVPAPATQRDAAGSALTVGTWAQRLAAETEQMGSHGPNTVATYAAMTKHVVAIWGSTKLQDLTREEVVRGLGGLRQTHAARTVRHVHARLHTLLSEAVRRGGLTRNPAGGIKLPAVERKGRALTDEEVTRMLTAARRSRMGMVVRFAYGTGLRRGEICGLRWSDFDAARGTVTVRRVIAQKGNSNDVWTKGPKTKSSARTVTLPASLLEETRFRQKEAAAIYAEARMDASEQPMFVNAMGDGWKPGALTQAVADFLRDFAKLPGFTLHDLRHAHATALLRQGGNPKAVSQRLGHSSAAMVMEVYAHALPADDERLAADMEEVMK